MGAWPGAGGRGSPAAGGTAGESTRSRAAVFRAAGCRSADRGVSAGSNRNRRATRITAVADRLEQGVFGRARERTENDESSRPPPRTRKGAIACRHELTGQAVRETARRNRQAAEEWAETRRSWPVVIPAPDLGPSRNEARHRKPP